MQNLGKLNDKNRIESENQQEKLKSKLSFKIAREEKYNELFNSIDIKKLDECFSELKLNVNVNNIRYNAETFEDLKTFPLLLDITATPLTGCKIKPVKFKGYTATGSTKNKPVMEEKARMLSNKITEITGYNVLVNEFCFEIDNTDKKFSLLCLIYITCKK